MKIWVVLRETYYGDFDLVSVHAGEDRAVAKCGALNEQLLRKPYLGGRNGQVAYPKTDYYFHPGTYCWKEKEVQA